MRILGAWLPAMLYMGLTWALSSLSNPHVPTESFPFQDKGLHFVEYAVLGFLLSHATRRTWPDRPHWRVAAVAVVIAAGWAILDEFHQAFVPSRTPDLRDFLADLLGITAGMIARMSITRWSSPSRVS